MSTAVSNNPKKEGGNDSGTFQLVVFKLGQEEYALSIDQIKEVVITPSITRMPQTFSFVRGVANIRGNIITILDLEEKFRLSSSLENTHSGNNYTLVIESEEYKMGILVKEVPNTLTISSADIERTTLAGEREETGYIKGIVKIDKRLVILIDIFKVLTDQEMSTSFKRNTVTVAA